MQSDAHDRRASGRTEPTASRDQPSYRPPLVTSGASEPNQGRAHAWAALGAVLSIAGCGWVLASLWYPWAVDGPHSGVVADLNGWQTMSIGDVPLVGALVVVVAVVGWLGVGRPSRRAARLAGLVTLSTLGLAACGAAFVWWLLGWDFVVMDPGDFREYGRGGGPRRAVEGLAIAAVGVICAMRSRRWATLPVEPTQPAASA